MLRQILKRHFSTSTPSSLIKAPPLVYISGEEMTRYASQLYLDKWIKPYMDISNWEFYDLSCKSRDDTNDQVLKDCIDAGKRIGAIYKEPTITPTEEQKLKMNLKRTLGSPNGAMRRGWNGITISRDTIQIPGMELGYKGKVLFDRHAVGGEYGAGYKSVGAGKVITVYTPDNKYFASKSGKYQGSTIVDERELTDECNAIVLYHNPYDNVNKMAHHFFSRCLEAKVTPYVVTKKTVFKWQEEFWKRMKDVFDVHYKKKFLEAGLLEICRGELQHFLSDVATMQLIRWSEGNFGMCAHNYDGDVLTDEIAQIHKSPGFLTSVLNGVREDGAIIKEFEASHGTVTDMWNAQLRGEETSLNPLSMIEALIGSIQHSVKLTDISGGAEIIDYTVRLQNAIYAQMTTKGKATRDLSGHKGLTTEQFVDAVRDRVDGRSSAFHVPDVDKDSVESTSEIDEHVKILFQKLDKDGNGLIDLKEFANGLVKLGISPKKGDNNKKF
jgi:isocitrate dehydrogenase